MLGAEPGSGAFVVGYNDDPQLKPHMSYFKMGDGPLYMFYRPFHLAHLEAPLSVARAVLFGDASIAPAGPPVLRGRRGRQARPGSGRGTGRHRRLRLLRADRQRREHPPGWRPAHRPGRRRPPDPPGRPGPADPHRRRHHARQDGWWMTCAPSRTSTSACRRPAAGARAHARAPSSGARENSAQLNARSNDSEASAVESGELPPTRSRNRYVVTCRPRWSELRVVDIGRMVRDYCPLALGRIKRRRSGHVGTATAGVP